MMNVSPPPPPPPPHGNNLSGIKDRSSLSQVMTYKASVMERIMLTLHSVAQRSCSGARHVLCCPPASPPCEKLTWWPAQTHQCAEDGTTQVALRGSPSTILIVNISNSTLIDCVIGKETYSSVVEESQPLMQERPPPMHDQLRCSCSHGQQGAAHTPPSPLPPAGHQSISIHSSHLSCIIIGDNNYMHAEQSRPTEPEQADESEASAAQG